MIGVRDRHLISRPSRFRGSPPAVLPLGAAALAAAALAGCGGSGPRGLDAAQGQRLLGLIRTARADAARHDRGGVDRALTSFVSEVGSLRSGGTLTAAAAGSLTAQARTVERQAAAELSGLELTAAAKTTAATGSQTTASTEIETTAVVPAGTVTTATPASTAAPPAPPVTTVSATPPPAAGQTATIASARKAAPAARPKKALPHRVVRHGSWWKHLGAHGPLPPAAHGHGGRHPSGPGGAGAPGLGGGQ